MQETRVQSLIQEDPLEKKMATHCSILAWRIPWTEEPGRLQYSPWGHTESDRTEWLTLSLLFMVTMFNLSRNCQTVFQSDCTVLPSHQQCKTRFSTISLHLCQYLLLLVFESSHPGVCEVIPHMWYLFLIYLMAKDIEYLFICLLAFFTSSVKQLFRSLAHF